MGACARAVLTAAAVLATVGAPAGCGPDVPARVPAPPVRSEACAQRPTTEGCASINVDGVAHRYGLTRAAPGRRTVVVDFGGPGLSVLGGAFRLSSYAAEHPELAGYNLLFLEEPWVARPLTPACDAALTAYYHTLRTAPRHSGAAGDGLVRACLTGRGWGFDPALYAAALRRIAEVEHLDLEGFVGYSFGDVRFAYAQDLGFRWAVFVRPYPVGVSGREIVDSRAAALDAVVRGARRQPARVDEATGSRSLPVTAFDRLSAQVQLAYLDEASLARYGRGVVDGSSIARIGSFSDALWQRYGTEQVSPAYLAFLDEVCRTARDWPAVTTIGKPRDVIAASTAPCRTLRSDPVRWTAATATCAVISESDPVVPAGLARRLVDAHPGWSRVITASPVHSSSDGLAACLKRVMA